MEFAGCKQTTGEFFVSDGGAAAGQPSRQAEEFHAGERGRETPNVHGHRAPLPHALTTAALPASCGGSKPNIIPRGQTEHSFGDAAPVV